MKVGFLITARLKSSRLKKKLLLPFGNENYITQLVRRLKTSPYLDEIVICNANCTYWFAKQVQHQINFMAQCSYHTTAHFFLCGVFCSVICIRMPLGQIVRTLEADFKNLFRFAYFFNDFNQWQKADTICH